MTAPTIPGDTIPGTHFQLAPEWSHVETLTIAVLAYVFCEPVRVVRGGAWLAGDEIEYLADDTVIPAVLLDPILTHLAEVHERKHGLIQTLHYPMTMADAVAWLCVGEPVRVWDRFGKLFTPEPVGGYWLKATLVTRGLTAGRLP